MVAPWTRSAPDPTDPAARAQRGAVPPKLDLGFGISVFSGKGDPNGVRRGRMGSLYVERDASPPGIWVNTDGAFAWSRVGGGMVATGIYIGNGGVQFIGPLGFTPKSVRVQTGPPGQGNIQSLVFADDAQVFIGPGMSMVVNQQSEPNNPFWAGEIAIVPGGFNVIGVNSNFLGVVATFTAWG